MKKSLESEKRVLQCNDIDIAMNKAVAASTSKKTIEVYLRFIGYCFCIIARHMCHEMREIVVHDWRIAKKKHITNQSIEEERKQLRENAGQDVYVISGPSGSGKTSVIKEVLRELPNAAAVPTCTTRTPRIFENGDTEKDYHFISRQEFQEIIAHNGFIEYAQVHGELYGTPYASLDLLKLEGKTPLILSLEPTGAAAIKSILPASTSIFILPPSAKELYRRLQQRGTETSEQIQMRMRDSLSQIKEVDNYNYDFIVTNDAISETAKAIQHIIEVQTYRPKLQRKTVKTQISDLATFLNEGEEN